MGRFLELAGWFGNGCGYAGVDRPLPDHPEQAFGANKILADIRKSPVAFHMRRGPTVSIIYLVLYNFVATGSEVTAPGYH